MSIAVKLPDDVRAAIGEMIERRRSNGLVCTGAVIRELRQSFPLSNHTSRDLANAIAKNAVERRVNVHFDQSALPLPFDTPASKQLTAQ